MRGKKGDANGKRKRSGTGFTKVPLWPRPDERVKKYMYATHGGTGRGTNRARVATFDNSGLR